MSVVSADRVLSREERNELIGAACFMHVRREELARQFLNQERYVSSTNPPTHSLLTRTNPSHILVSQPGSHTHTCA